MQKYFKIQRIAFVANIFLVLALLSACAGKTPPTIARDVAVNGEALVKAITATAQAVMDAEKRGAITRNQAVASVQVFQRIGKEAEQVANQLDALVTVTDTTASGGDRLAQIQAALDSIDAGILQALIPISDDTTRQQVAQLALEVNKIISQINREILARR